MRTSLPRAAAAAPLVAAALAILVGGAGTALAGPRDVVVCYPGEAGTTKAAEPTMAELARAVERAGGLPASSLTFTYFPDEASCRKFIEEKKPGFAILSPDLYLELKKERPLHLLAQSEQKVPNDPKGRTALRYHLLVKKDGPIGSLADLEGKPITTPHASDELYAARVLLGGKLDDPRFDPAQALAAIKGVLKGDRTAVLLDDFLVESLPAVKGAKEGLREVYVSAPVPTAPVVAIGDVAPGADREAVKKGFLGLAAEPENRKLLEMLRSTGFREPDGKAYERLEAAVSISSEKNPTRAPARADAESGAGPGGGEAQPSGS